MLAGKYRPIVTELFDCAKPYWTKKSQWILIVHENENRYVYMDYKVMLVWSRTKAEYLPALSLLGRSCKPISLHRFITADTGIVRHFLLASNFNCFKIKINICDTYTACFVKKFVFKLYNIYIYIYLKHDYKLTSYIIWYN